MIRAREKGIKFNDKKLQIAEEQVKYMGHIITAVGIKADPDKVEAINWIPSPKNVAELSRFLGMITYLAKYIPNLSSMNTNLRKLKKDVHWIWTEAHQKEFDTLKLALSKSPVLQFYDKRKPITLSVDSFGMGAVILQDGKPVAYASKSLSETQQRYAQIEKEMLAIVFGCQRFHQYLYGKEFLVETNHRPLKSSKRNSTNTPCVFNTYE